MYIFLYDFYCILEMFGLYFFRTFKCTKKTKGGVNMFTAEKMVLEIDVIK